jgi:hypothetical protein
MVSSGDISTADSYRPQMNIYQVARDLGLFKGNTAWPERQLDINVRDGWIKEYKSRNGIRARLKHAWAVLTGKAFAITLS